MLKLNLKNLRRWVVCGLALLLCAGCLSGRLDSASEVKDLRCLAIKTNPPELIVVSADQPIAPFQLTALMVDPSAEVNSAPLIVRACPPRRRGRCDLPEQTLIVHRSTQPVGEIMIDVQLTTEFMLTVLEEDLYNGFGGLTVMLHWEYGTIHASKLMVFGYPEPAGRQPNKIPRIQDITFDGTSIFQGEPQTLSGDTEFTVLPLPVAGSQEAYQLMSFEGALLDETERISYAWYATHGRFSPSNTGGRTGPKGSGATDRDTETTWKSPDDYIGPVQFWAVIRDERGGTSWRSFSANVVAPSAAP